MREIKYRAWDKQTSTLRDVLVIDWVSRLVDLSGGIIERSFDEVILMQYTGLKDKNGVEIYEGDILNVLEISGIKGEIIEKGYTSAVIFEDYGWMVEEGDGIQVPLVLLDSSKDWVLSDIEIKVIGNIYENPELLEAQHG